MSNDAPTSISDDEVVALAQQILRQSRVDIDQRAEQTPRELQQQQPGITIDLGHKNIVRLPDEVIDVIRAEIERLALSHNLLTTLPSRLIGCKRLRYLNVRHNQMREIPEAILGMPSLEILDVSRNRITVIPPKIANLTSLKVLAIAKNRIEELPVCLGDINSLQVLKLDGNPLKFPPPEVCRIQENVPSPANENVRDAAIATQVKKFMRQASQEKRVETERLRVESSGDESWTESNPETPRPSRRVNGGRFPVRPSIGSVDGFNESRPGSPGIAPPIPSRSHYRNQSSQNGFIRRPNISPLILSNGSNERNRSQSEGATSASHRQKRMGIYTNKTSELGAVDELKRNNHFRNFSQGYVQPGNASNGMSGPATAIGYGDSTTVRSLANRPLSDVREHRRDSRAPDVVVEAAKNFLYAMSQIHDSISGILQTIRRADRSEEGIRRVKDFKRRYELTYKHISELDERLRAFDTLSEEAEDDANKLSQDIYSCTLKSIEHFMSLNLSIAENRVIIVKKVDPRQLRTYLFLHQGSLVEMRNACAILGADFSDSAPASRGPSRTDLMSTVRARPKARRYQASPPQRNGHYPGPPAVVLHSNDNSRTNTLTSITSISAATPRSGESFSTLATTMSRANTLTSTFDEHDEDVHFERIYAKLRNACDSCSAHIPEISQILRLKFETLRRELDSDDPKLKVLMGLIDKCALVMESIHALGQRLSQVQLKDSHSRCQPGFWQQCMSFIKAWGELAAASTGDGRNMGLLDAQVKAAMKPLHKKVKEASLAINDSPWSHLTSNNPGTLPPTTLSSFTSRTQPPRLLNKPMINLPGNSAFPGPINTSITSVASAYSQQAYSTSSIGSGSGGYGTPVPATPLLSAALGAAAQATVPNTPNTLSHPPGAAPASTINLFERADRLLSQTARRV